MVYVSVPYDILTQLDQTLFHLTDYYLYPRCWTRPNTTGRGQNLEVEAEAKFKEAKQNIIIHSDNLCYKTLRNR